MCLAFCPLICRAFSSFLTFYTSILTSPVCLDNILCFSVRTKVVCVSVPCVCAFVCMHKCVRSEVSIQCHSLSLSNSVFEAGSPAEHRAHWGSRWASGVLLCCSPALEFSAHTTTRPWCRPRRSAVGSSDSQCKLLTKLSSYPHVKALNNLWHKNRINRSLPSWFFLGRILNPPCLYSS